MYLYSIVSTVPYYLFLLFLLVCYVFLYFVFCQSAQVANKHLKNKICFVLNVACSCGAGVSGPARFEAWLDSLSRWRRAADRQRHVQRRVSVSRQRPSRRSVSNGYMHWLLLERTSAGMSALVHQMPPIICFSRWWVAFVTVQCRWKFFDTPESPNFLLISLLFSIHCNINITFLMWGYCRSEGCIFIIHISNRKSAAWAISTLGRKVSSPYSYRY